MRQSHWEWCKKIWSGAQHLDFAATVLGYITSPKGLFAMSGAALWGVLAYFDGLPWSLQALYALAALVMIVFLIEALIRIRRSWQAERPEIRKLLDDSAALAELLLDPAPYSSQSEQVLAAIKSVEEAKKYVYFNNPARTALLDFLQYCKIAAADEKRYATAADYNSTRKQIHDGPLKIAGHLGVPVAGVPR